MTPDEEYFKNTSIEQMRRDLEEVIRNSGEASINGSG